MLHSTVVTKQRTAKWPYIANLVFALYKIMVNKVNFRSFRGGDRPNHLPLYPPLFSDVTDS